MCLFSDALLFPIQRGYSHIDDVAAVHLMVVLSAEACGGYISTTADWDMISDIVKSAFPEAVAGDIFTRGEESTMLVDYDSDETRRIL